MMFWLPSIFGGPRRHRGWQSSAPFRSLGKRERRFLEKRFERHVASPGTRISEEGQPADALIFVDSGAVELLKKDPRTGREHLVGTVSAGQMIGEHALLDGKPRATSARTTEESRLLFLPFEPLRQKAARSETSTEKRIYQDLLVGLTESLASRAREHVDLSLESARQRAIMGEFIVNVLILVCGYVLFLNALPLFWGKISATTETFSLPLVLVFGLFSWRFMKQSGYPLSHFGIGLKHLPLSLVESLVFTVPFLALITAIKACLLWINGSSAPIIEHPELEERLSEPNVVLWLRIYAATAVVQELIVRGALQSSLEAFLTGPGRRTRAILVCALLFSISHLHISYLFALIAIVPGLFWGWLYSRRPNLLGVSLSHIIVGGYAFFVLGVRV